MQARYLLTLLNIVITTIIVFSVLTVSAILYDPTVVGLAAPETAQQDDTEESKPLTPTLSPELSAAKRLFKANCAACHDRNMKNDLTGPALAGVVERWGDYPEADLYEWIRNSAKLIDSGHPRAVQVFKDWQQRPMNAFPNLSDEEIAGLLAYIKHVGG